MSLQISLKKSITVLAASAFMILAVLVGQTTVSAQTSPDIDGGLDCGSGLDFREDCDTGSLPDPATRVNSIVNTVINILSLVVGVVAVIMIIVGGLRYVTSGGDSGSVGNAKNTILYAIVGLVVVALAQIIVRFVVNRATA